MLVYSSLANDGRWHVVAVPKIPNQGSAILSVLRHSYESSSEPV